MERGTGRQDRQLVLGIRPVDLTSQSVGVIKSPECILQLFAVRKAIDQTVTLYVIGAEKETVNKMTKTVTAYIGILLLAMHFSSQVHAQNSTTGSPALTGNMTDTPWTSSTMPKVTTKNITNPITNPKGASPSLQSSAFMLLIPVVGSLLQGRF
ncbi:hypothetical protein J4Q44_G00222260 [Coregonus suidteri]|uniref:Uncharacterized protein n=1 Tax=Coregonus suidteri TaxID=861788 RepID=A0AAN8L8A0_9TELE